MKLLENDDVGHDLGDSFLDLKLARLADGRILAVPAFHNAAALILPRDVREAFAAIERGLWALHDVCGMEER